MFCDLCGHSLAIQDRFCSQCGAAVKRGAPSSAREFSSPQSDSAVIAEHVLAGPESPPQAAASEEEAAPPCSPPAEAPVTQPLPWSYAGFWRRVVAWLIDSAALVIVVLLASLFLEVLVGVFFLAAGGEGALESSRFERTSIYVIEAAGIVCFWLYYAFLESSSWRATLGKKALGMSVVDLEGKRISFARATGRNLAKLISAIFLFAGFLMAGFTSRKQSLHDMYADCVVIRR